MRLGIWYLLLAFVVISTTVSAAYAQEPRLTVRTDDTEYKEGDTVIVSGNVEPVIGQTPVLLQVQKGGTQIDVAQIEVAQDGRFSHPFLAERGNWAKQGTGEYTITASYHIHKVQTKFMYTLDEDEVEVVLVFENIDAGSAGTFDIEYTISGAAIEDIAVDHENFGLLVKIDAAEDGHLTLNLPREFIGAEKQTGEDEEFIIWTNNTQIQYKESGSNSEIRRITFNFEQEDSEIQIIGTYAVPEFGVIMAVLAASIAVSVLASKRMRI